MKRRHRRLIFAAIFAVLFTIGWRIGSNPGPDGELDARNEVLAQEGEPQDVQRAVRLLTVEARPLARSLTESGRIVPRRQVTLALEVGGTVQDVLVEVGQRVETGDVLVRLGTDDLELAHAQRQAALAAAEANLAKARAGATDEELRQAESAFAQAQTQLEQADEALARSESLFRAGAITSEQYDLAASQARLAELSLESAQAQLETVRRGARQEDIQVLEAQRDQAEVTLLQAARQLESAELRAPFDGVVAVRHVTAGEMAGPGSPAMTLVQLDEVLVEIGVSERQINEVRPGQAVTVTVGAVDVTVSGEVFTVSPVVDSQGRRYPVQVQAPNPAMRLRPGMLAEATFPLTPVPSRPVVPAEAVVDSARDPAVFVAVRTGGLLRAERRPVRLGEASDGWIQILEGVSAGEQVIVAGQTLVTHGEAIRPVEGDR